MAAKTKVRDPRAAGNALRTLATRQFEQLLAWTATSSEKVRAFEPALWHQLCALGLLLFQIFLAEREARLPAAQSSPRATVMRRVHTLFGVVLFSHVYVRHPEGGGHFPLDHDVGLHPDLVSPHLAGLGARMATRMSFENASETLAWFLPTTIPVSTLQKVALGLGAQTQEFLETLAPPDGDGEVAVAMVDCKCIPTATDVELRKRRGKRAGKPRAASPRHRRRRDRMKGAPRRRRRAGDKAKNGRQVVVVVVYTLKRRGGLLLGPLNQRVFTVVGPKELGFVWLRTELERRGFGPLADEKVVQFLSDGDPDLQALAAKYISHARCTLDLYHGLEYVAEAGHVLFPKDADAFDRWYRDAKGHVLRGDVAKVLKALQQYRASIPKTGPGTKSKRETLDKVLTYLGTRAAMMNYGELVKLDMDIGTGAAEGAVKYLVGARFDHGGMRWLRERANALLQLRCIEENGLWEQFLARVFDGSDAKLPASARILRTSPAPLPTVPALKKAA